MFQSSCVVPFSSGEPVSLTSRRLLMFIREPLIRTLLLFKGHERSSACGSRCIYKRTEHNMPKAEGHR